MKGRAGMLCNLKREYARYSMKMVPRRRMFLGNKRGRRPKLKSKEVYPKADVCGIA